MAIALLLAVLLAGCQTPHTGYLPDDPATARVRLSRSRDGKLLFRAKAPGGRAWFLVDTGAPITCAEISKASVFQFKPVPLGAGPSAILMNGQQGRMALIPQLEFGGVTQKDVPVVGVDLFGMIRQANCSRYDGILGLDDLIRSHAVIDFGNRTLFMHAQSARGKIPAGWQAVPMRVVGNHLVVPAAINGVASALIVDSGSPVTLIDTEASKRLRIPVRKHYHFTMTALNYQTRTAQVGRISNLRLGATGIGPTLVGVLDLHTLVDPRSELAGIPGLIGLKTLEQLKAIVDLDAMQLYISLTRPR